MQRRSILLVLGLAFAQIMQAQEAQRRSYDPWWAITSLGASYSDSTWSFTSSLSFAMKESNGQKPLLLSEGQYIDWNMEGGYFLTEHWKLGVQSQAIRRKNHPSFIFYPHPVFPSWLLDLGLEVEHIGSIHKAELHVYGKLGWVSHTNEKNQWRGRGYSNHIGFQFDWPIPLSKNVELKPFVSGRMFWAREAPSEIEVDTRIIDGSEVSIGTRLKLPQWSSQLSLFFMRRTLYLFVLPISTSPLPDTATSSEPQPQNRVFHTFGISYTYLIR